MSGYQLGPKALKQIADAVHSVRMQVQNGPQARGRWQKGGGSVRWAVNIGTLAPASSPLTGARDGRAALLELNDDGDLEITDEREDFKRRDQSGTIEDGTLIQIGQVSGEIVIVWAACASISALEDLDP